MIKQLNNIVWKINLLYKKLFCQNIAKFVFDARSEIGIASLKNDRGTYLVLL